MDKMQMAHEYMQNTLNLLQKHDIPYDFESLIEESFDYADAMQAEADKRKPSGLPDALCEVDWTQAPSSAIGWMFFDGASTWLGADGFLIEDAPSFGFTGTHIMERPE